MTIATIRAGLAKNLATIPGLRVAATVPDQVNIPMAVVALDNISYDEAFRGGLVQYEFTVTCFVGRASERTAQRKLDEYADTTLGGVKRAIESDKSLDGAAFDVRVTNMNNITAVSLGEVDYLTADFVVMVYAD